ncbi:1-phosphofructokinase [Demequina sp. SYSU T00039]|uniref:1-phosphofructokinase n=1 Tax=Demequina lignilytica TaxID=3051663 RepID=A0AAW7M8N9_9MICO|nr:MULTISPECIES: 1-phosphofructokinase [unclassified Demequina]MDN4477609.1 1-phosphofructokinase [Demequina sp. SYSU T00039-1]MDN4488040.1 1-phosphofructokinase [Demequina sp. SYSU T00039]MDN4490480.1 1-phosphofructokinase [Demequina sp. SYSU T00068]
MIVTLTPNPSVDRAVTLDALVRGEVLRASDVRVDAGGKGVNVARAITAQGGDAIAVLPVGGPEGHLLEELLDAADVPRRSVAITGSARMNISVLEPDGTTTKLNEPGPELAEAEVEAMLDATLEAAAGAAWVVGCGSLPPGAPVDLYGQLVARVHAGGGKVAIDSSGPALAAAVAATPDLIKPNHEELEELVGRALPTLGDVQDAARDLVAQGIGIVCVSLGRHGALLVTADELLHSWATITTPLSTVGAGDCMLAGMLHGLTRGLDHDDALAEGVAWGAAAVTLPGSRVPHPEDLHGIPVDLTHSPDAGTTLAEN